MIIDYIVYFCFAVSAFITVSFMARHKWGRTVWLNCPARKHNIQAIDVIAMFMLFILSGFIVQIFVKNTGSFSLKTHIILSIQQLFVAFFALFLCHFRFKNGLKGLKLTVKPVKNNIIRVVFYSIMVFSFTFFTLTLTGLIVGFVPQHPFLKELTGQSSVATIVVIFISGAILAPVAEELLFRGLLQTFLSRVLAIYSCSGLVVKNDSVPLNSKITDCSSDTYTDDINTNSLDGSAEIPPAFQPARWGAIFITAAVFALFHGTWQHWPALFVLACGFGYVYERYNNLLLAIMMHCLFNSLELGATLLQNHSPL